MLAIVALFAMLMVEAAKAEQADNTQSPDPALNYWTGRIEQDTTWRDTVYVSGDVTIASGATLTLAPNTKVHFVPYRDEAQGGLDSTRTELIVEGRLNARAGGIVFCSAAATSLGADWYGIVVERTGIADVSNAMIRDGLRCLYAKMGGRVTMDNIAFANCGKQTAQSFSRRSAASDSTQVDAHLAVSGLRATPDSLVENRGFMSTGKRVALKLITGTVGGLMGVMIVTESLPCFWKDYQGDRPIFCDSLGPALLYGYPAGIAIGVSQVVVKTVDPRVRSEMSLIKSLGVSLGGSAVGLIGGILLTHVNADMFWPSFFISPIVGATWASERWCPPPAARHVSVGLVPYPKGSLSAVATLRF